MYKIHSNKILCEHLSSGIMCHDPFDLSTLLYEGQVYRWLRSTRLGNSKHPCMLDFPHIT